MEQGSLTGSGACDSLRNMDESADSSSFSVRRQVGRPSTPRQVLWQLEEMRKFSKNTLTENQSSSRATFSRFEKLLAGLVPDRVDFAVFGGVDVIVTVPRRRTSKRGG